MRLSTFGLAALALSTPVLAGTDDPAAVVTEIVKMDKGGWEPVFAVKPTALMRRYFTQAFNRSWTVAMSHNSEGPVLDGDPITGDQSVTRVALKSTRASGGADKATVAAELLVTEDGVKDAIPQTVVFSLAREAGAWKIDDIKSANMPSLRAYFKKTYGG
jgi:hypothetical protein